jgi:hypothetical protein
MCAWSSLPRAGGVALGGMPAVAPLLFKGEDLHHTATKVAR